MGKILAQVMPAFKPSIRAQHLSYHGLPLLNLSVSRARSPGVPFLTIDKLETFQSMGTNRKQRAKSEGTFLESVKGLLTQLSREVADIKSAVSEMHLLYNFTTACQPNWFYDESDLDSWQTWEALGYQNVSMPDATSVDKSQLGCSVDSLTAPPQTIGVDTLSRELLLQLRQS